MTHTDYQSIIIGYMAARLPCFSDSFDQNVIFIVIRFTFHTEGLPSPDFNYEVGAYVEEANTDPSLDIIRDR